MDIIMPLKLTSVGCDVVPLHLLKEMVDSCWAEFYVYCQQ